MSYKGICANIRDDSSRNGIGDIRHERTERERHTSTTRVRLIVAEKLSRGRERVS